MRRHAFSVCHLPASLQEAVWDRGVIISQGNHSIVTTVIHVLYSWGMPLTEVLVVTVMAEIIAQIYVMQLQTFQCCSS